MKMNKKFEEQLKEQFAEATGHKFEEMVRLEFEEWKKGFIEELKKEINKLTIYTRTSESIILIRRAYVLDKIDKVADNVPNTQSKMENKKTNWVNVTVWFLIYLGLVSVGIIIGMTYQQALFKHGIIEVLSYSDVEVNIDLNETIMVDKMIDFFNETINWSKTSNIK